MIHSSLPCYVFPFSSLYCKFYSDLTCFRSLSSCKIPALPDRESELANSRLPYPLQSRHVSVSPSSWTCIVFPCRPSPPASRGDTRVELVA